MANQFSVTPPSLQGLGHIAQALGQKSVQNQAEEKKAAELERQKASASQSMQFLNQAAREQDPVKADELYRQAYLTDKEFVTGFMQNMKTRGETEKLNQPVGQMTPYQGERLKIDKKGLELREIESKLRQEANKNNRKSLENRLKKERIQLNELERKLAAESRGGEAQRLLRDSTEGSKAALSFSRRMTVAGLSLDKLEKTIDPASRVIGYIAGSTGITSEAANRLASPEEQSYATAASDFVTAQLRDESGAVIGTDEFDRKYREFFPMPGDSEDQIKLKSNRRNAAAQDMRNLSSGLYETLYGERAEQAENQTAENQGAPEVGFIDSGFKFIGGDPSQQSSWEAQ